MVVVIIFTHIDNELFSLGQVVPDDVTNENTLREPSTLVINTDPKTPGVQVLIDGERFQADDDGRIVFNTNTDQHIIELPNPLYFGELYNETSENLSSSLSSLLVTFGRWEPFMPMNFTINLNPGTRTNLELGVIRSSEVSFEFVDANSNPLNLSNIERLLLISNIGNVKESTFPFKEFLEDNYLTKKRIIQNENNVMVVSSVQLFSEPQKYRVNEVLMNGLNVVDKSTNLEFYPENTSNLVLKTRVYPLKIQLSDRIFGFPINAGVSLEVTDELKLNSSEKRSVPLNFKIENGELVIPQLPKATYIIKVEKGIGFGGSAAIVLSKPQEVHLSVITYTTAIILGVILLGALIVVLLLIRKITRYIFSRVAKKPNNKGM